MFHWGRHFCFGLVFHVADFLSDVKKNPVYIINIPNRNLRGNGGDGDDGDDCDDCDDCDNGDDGGDGDDCDCSARLQCL